MVGWGVRVRVRISRVRVRVSVRVRISSVRVRVRVKLRVRVRGSVSVPLRGWFGGEVELELGSVLGLGSRLAQVRVGISVSVGLP